MVAFNITKPKFPLGKVVATPSALAALRASGQTPGELLRRHVAGDWGAVSAADRQANDESLAGGELLSSYRTALGTKIWIITAADRSATTLLLPEEY